MAEAVFRDLVKREQLQDVIEVDSAGTGHWHEGNTPHAGTREKLESENISWDGILARQVREEDWDVFDYIVPMDSSNVRNLRKLNKDAPIVKLMEYVPNPKEVDVPDPYMTDNFDYTYELVVEGCHHLLKRIKEDKSL